MSTPTGHESDSPNEVTLDAFVGHVVAHLADFKASYRRGQLDAADDPNQYWPDEQGLADWWEQFMTHEGPS